jgi:hypothetical protein
MSNPYVLGGYLAVAAILGVYVWHLRRRARILTRTLSGGSPPSSSPSSTSPSSAPAPDGEPGHRS